MPSCYTATSVINLGLCVHRTNVKLRPALDVIFQTESFELQALAEMCAGFDINVYVFKDVIFNVYF